jgi:hypothetical protein
MRAVAASGGGLAIALTPPGLEAALARLGPYDTACDAVPGRSLTPRRRAVAEQVYTCMLAFCRSRRSHSLQLL